MSEQLVDLDELVILCRNNRVKTYIAESIACYKASAFRSCIVATWIAVTYDIIDKLQELALAGDKEAETQIDKFDKIRVAGDVAQALIFEKSLLELAKNKFELLSPVEYIDLCRLQEDRNRCAHPSMISDEEAYTPSAELARTHMRIAITSLLRHPPVQGKTALDRLLRDVDSDYFPTQVESVVKHFQHGPLAKPRESLKRNFSIILLKKLIVEEPEHSKYRKYAVSLNAIREMYRESIDKVLSDKLSDLIRSLDQEHLHRVTKFLHYVDDIWDFFAPDVQQLITRYVTNMPAKVISSLPGILHIKPLHNATDKRITKMDSQELNFHLRAESHPRITNARIRSFAEAASYNSANEFAKILNEHADSLTGDQISNIIKVASENGQILGSFEWPRLLESIQRTRKISTGKLNELLENHGLKKYQLSDSTVLSPAVIETGD